MKLQNQQQKKPSNKQFNKWLHLLGFIKRQTRSGIIHHQSTPVLNGLTCINKGLLFFLLFSSFCTDGLRQDVKFQADIFVCLQTQPRAPARLPVWPNECSPIILHSEHTIFAPEWKLTIGTVMNIFLLFSEAVLVVFFGFFCLYTLCCQSNLQLEGYKDRISLITNAFVSRRTWTENVIHSSQIPKISPVFK